jgi:hypothetical protein
MPEDSYVRLPEISRDTVLSRVLEEQDIHRAQTERRRSLLRSLEVSDDGRKVGVVAFLCSESSGYAIDSDDIPALGDALLAIGDVDQLDLIIKGPGGDGTIAEKMIELCRCYCKTFRVIVPNRAKSAATIVALGADEIVMGHCSELGPIDAQVVVATGGLPRFISAQSFIDARDSLERRFAEAVKKGEDPRAVLQQIALLDPPFIDHCEKLMDFSRDVAESYLAKYMFRDVDRGERDRLVKNALKRLSSVSIFKVHGRMIDGNAAKTELKLRVRLLPKDDPRWKGIWDYYVRGDVLMQKGGVGKLIETRESTLIRLVGVAE